jgi:hypothetical protein
VRAAAAADVEVLKQAMTGGASLRSFPGYLKWRSTRLEFETLSEQTIRYAIQWYNMAIGPSISQELATAI